jgi:tripartite-type tricarboxylate transporter receptor subunit TctC
MPGAWPLVEGKKLRAIAVSSAKRHPIAPDVPTVAEAGLPGFEAESWLGLAAPAGTPDEVIQILNRAANQAMQAPSVRDKLLAMGTRPVGGTSEEFRQFVENQVATWKRVLGAAGVKPQ